MKTVQLQHMQAIVLYFHILFTYLIFNNYFIKAGMKDGQKNTDLFFLFQTSYKKTTKNLFKRLGHIRIYIYNNYRLGHDVLKFSLNIGGHGFLSNNILNSRCQKCLITIDVNIARFPLYIKIKNNLNFYN